MLSRIERLRKEWRPEWADSAPWLVDAMRDEYVPELPPLEGGAYLAAYLFEVGPTMSGGMGASPLTFGEIDSWCKRTGIDLLAWEGRVLRRLSIEYLNESNRAQKIDCAPPWQQEGAKPMPTAAQMALRALAS